jgi:hypothetical protein
VREEAPPGFEAFRLTLEQETSDGRIAEQASARVQVPAWCVPRGTIAIQAQAPAERPWSVSIDQIAVRGTIDRPRLARAREEVEI